MSQVDTNFDTRQLEAVIAARERDLANVLTSLESKKVARARLETGIIQDEMQAKGFAKELRTLGGRRNVKHAKQIARQNGTNGSSERQERGDPNTANINVRYPGPPDLVTTR